MKRRPTFSEIVVLWKDEKRQYVKQSTYAAYCFLLQNHLLPAFGSMRDITDAAVQQFVNCKLSAGLSQKSVKDMLVVQKSTHTIVQDRSIFEGVYVFVRNNYERGDLSKRDYETFMELFDLMKSQMKMPDMMIYLRKSVPALIAQIQKRGRDYEQTMQIDYLMGLNEKYEDFIFHKYEGRVLVIESDGMDFENNPADFRKVIDKVDAELFGLFSENNWTSL